MFVMCPLGHNYSVITQDNWHLAYCDPKRSKDHKTVDRVCLFVCLILYVPSTIFQLYRDESSWVEPVLS